MVTKFFFKMFPLVEKCAERFVQSIEKCGENKDFDIERLELDHQITCTGFSIYILAIFWSFH